MLARLYLLLLLVLEAVAQQVVTLQSTSPEIDYSPALCDASTVDCVSAWQTADDVPGVALVATYGPVSEADNIIPQLFLTFRASALALRTSPYSNATINLTLSASPSTTYNSSIGYITVRDLPETQTTTLGVTFVPGDAPTRFDVEWIALTVGNASATSEYLPTLALPASSSPPTLVLPTSSASASAKGPTAGAIAGAVVGAVVGSLVLVVVGIMCYRRRRQRMGSVRLGER